MKNKISLLLVIVIGILPFMGFAQESSEASRPSSYEEKLKKVFQEWERPDRPGGVVAILEKGEVVYKRCFGLANVEYELPNTPETVFDVGPIAEAVTGMAVAMLEGEGKLSVSEPLRKYFPELPASMNSLEVVHLLYHTSGLADWSELLTLAGWNEGDVITFDHILKLVRRQNALLFDPGTRYSFSRTNYVLLAELVRRVTGESLRDWAWSQIFYPLGMFHTRFHDNHREVVENRAYSINYHYRDGYLKGADNLSAAGACSLFTTLDDLIKWVANLETHKVGSSQVREKLLTSGKLSDGTVVGHSYGLSVETYKGLEQLRKSGGWGGFRSTFRYYPETSLTIILLSNWDYNWNDPDSYADEAADVCLVSLIKEGKKEESPAEKKEAVSLNPEVLAQYEGEYRWRPGFYVTISQENNTLALNIQDRKYKLTAAGEAEFAFEDPNVPLIIAFFKDSDGKVSHLAYGRGTPETKVPRVKREELTSEQLKLYQGAYDCEELEARYEIMVRENQLALTSLKRGDIILTPENRSVFYSDVSGFQLLSFLMDESWKITGFRVDSDGVRHLKFKKTN